LEQLIRQAMGVSLRALLPPGAVLGLNRCWLEGALADQAGCLCPGHRVAAPAGRRPRATIPLEASGTAWLLMTCKQWFQRTYASAPSAVGLCPRLAERPAIDRPPQRPPTCCGRPADARVSTPQKFQQGGRTDLEPQAAGLRGDARRDGGPNHNRDHFERKRRSDSFVSPVAPGRSRPT